MHVQVNGKSIYYELNGPEDAPLITFSHALAANCNLWDVQARTFSRDYRVLCFDTRGHGRSSVPSGEYSMHELALDVLGLWDALDIDQSSFVGLSMGGMIGQVLATAFPERLDKLILCDTTCRIAPESRPTWQERINLARKQGMSALSQETLNRWLSMDFQAENPEETTRIKNMIEKTPVQGFAGCCQAISEFDVSGELFQVKAPTLVLVGENDTGTPVIAAEEIQANIPGAELEVLPKAQHLTNIEVSGEFNRRLLDFLQ